jgi:hypothetical protein
MTEPVFLHVELRIRPPEFSTFLKTMQEVAPLLAQSGWGFVGAWQVKVGRAYTLRVIWRLASADVFFAERRPLAEHPRLKDFRAVMESAIEEETVTMMVSVPYGCTGVIRTVA